MIVAQVRNDDPTQVLLVKHDHGVEALTPDGADHSLDERILPRRPRCDGYFADVHPVHPSAEVVAVDAVSVTEEVTGRVSQGNASTICCAVHAAVGYSVTLKWMTRRRS
jgi:hypothetical protein